MKESEVYQAIRATELGREMEAMQARGDLHTFESAIAFPTAMPLLCGTLGGINGSVSRSCKLCGRRVWASPTTQEILRKRAPRPSIIICQNCAIDRQADAMALVEAAGAEMAAGLREPPR